MWLIQTGLKQPNAITQDEMWNCLCSCVADFEAWHGCWNTILVLSEYRQRDWCIAIVRRCSRWIVRVVNNQRFLRVDIRLRLQPTRTTHTHNTYKACPKCFKGQSTKYGSFGEWQTQPPMSVCLFLSCIIITFAQKT